ALAPAVSCVVRLKLAAAHYVDADLCRDPVIRLFKHRQRRQGRCPLYPQKQTWFGTNVMSALCQKQTFAASVRRHPSVRKTSLSQAFGELGEIVRSTKRKHFVQIRDA